MISFRSKPFRIDFAGNRPRFDIKTQPYAVSAVNASVTYAVYQIPYVAGVVNTLMLATPFGTFTRRILSSTSGSSNPLYIRATSAPDTMADRLIDRLCNDPALTNSYRVEVWTGIGHTDIPCCFLRLTRIEAVSGETLPVLSYQQDDTECAVVESLPVIHLWENTAGRTGDSRDNYRVTGRFLITRKADQRSDYLAEEPSDERLETPPFTIWENGGTAVIDTRILQSYFHRMDLPAYGETLGAYPLHFNMLRYRLRMGDQYDGDTPLQHTTGEHILLNGIIRREEFVRNAPDWTTDPADFQISSANRLINWGTPRHARVRLFHGCEYYMYVANFTAATRTLYVSIETGGGSIHADTLRVPANTIVRIPVGTDALPSTLDIANDFHYTVDIKEARGPLATLQVELEAKPHFGRVLLLQNHLGIAETFVIDHIVFSRETSGNEVVINGERAVELSQHGTRLTLRTGYHPKEEMRLLADAFTNPDNYLLDGTLAYRINFVPGELTVTDEGEDLQSAEVQVTLGRPVQRGTAKAYYITTATVLDDGLVMNDLMVMCDLDITTTTVLADTLVMNDLMVMCDFTVTTRPWADTMRVTDNIDLAYFLKASTFQTTLQNA